MDVEYEESDENVEIEDILNYKGEYYENEAKKYQDPITGAHFQYEDLCRRLNAIKSCNDKNLIQAIKITNFKECKKYSNTFVEAKVNLHNALKNLKEKMKKNKKSKRDNDLGNHRANSNVLKAENPHKVNQFSSANKITIPTQKQPNVVTTTYSSFSHPTYPKYQPRNIKTNSEVLKQCKEERNVNKKSLSKKVLQIEPNRPVSSISKPLIILLSKKEHNKLLLSLNRKKKSENEEMVKCMPSMDWLNTLKSKYTISKNKRSKAAKSSSGDFSNANKKLKIHTLLQKIIKK